MGPVTINDVFVPNVTVERMFEHLMAILAAKKGVRLERPAPDVLTIHYLHARGVLTDEEFDLAK